MSLKEQSINGAFWTFIDILVNRGGYFIATILLARILGPKEFGLLGMIMIFVAIGNTLIDSGMSSSLLRTKDVTEKDYSTVFITNILMSMFVYVLLFVTAPYIASFYNQIILTEIIRWYCLGFVISSFRSIHNVKLMKEMKFKMITYLNLPGNIISVSIGVWLGFSGYGVWSLIWLFLINQIICTISFWIFIKWRPILDFDFKNYKYHFNFGYKLVIAAQLNTIFDNIYNILIGKFYDVKTLGFYERAYTFNNYPISVLSGIISKVSLPSMTLIKEDKDRLQKVYKNMMQMSFFISSTCLAFISLMAYQIIELFLGKQWLPLAPMFQVLTIAFAFYPIHSLNINILSIYGRSDLFLKLEIAKKIMVFIVVLICMNFGVMGLVWSSVITSFLALFINSYYSSKFLNYSTGKQLTDLVPTILIVGLTLVIVLILNKFIDSTSLIVQIFQSFIIALFVLVVLSEIIVLKPYNIFKELILEKFRK